jgi:hypothetical protein
MWGLGCSAATGLGRAHGARAVNGRSAGEKNAISPEPPAAVNPAPDWSAEAARAAQLTLRRKQEGSRRRVFGTWSRQGVIEPSIMDITPGETEHFDDGETRTWVNDHCYFTNRAPSDLPSGVPGAPSLWGKTVQVCQRSPHGASVHRQPKADVPAALDVP